MPFCNSNCLDYFHWPSFFKLGLYKCMPKFLFLIISICPTMYMKLTLSPFFLQSGVSSLNYNFHSLPHNVYLEFCLFCNPKFLCLIIFCSPTSFISLAIFSNQSFFVLSFIGLTVCILSSSLSFLKAEVSLHHSGYHYPVGPTMHCLSSSLYFSFQKIHIFLHIIYIRYSSLRLYI